MLSKIEGLLTLLIIGWWSWLMICIGAIGGRTDGSVDRAIIVWIIFTGAMLFVAFLRLAYLRGYKDREAESNLDDKDSDDG